MKKFILVFLILMFLLFNLSASTFAANVFKEGVYKASDFNFSYGNVYNVQNVSPTESVYLLLFDENQLQVQSIRLIPKSGSYNLLPMNPDYRIAIIGNGDVFIG